MSYYEITNFAPGLDSRRSELTSKPGTLETLNNAHINEGAEVQKRMAFVPIYLPTGSFGLQPLVSALQVFGSGTTPVGFPVSFTNPAGSNNVNYQRLTSPNTGSSSMSTVISSTLFNNQAVVAAEYVDNYTYTFYGGSLIPDFTNGLVLSWQNTDNQIASALATQVNFISTAANEVTGELIYTAMVNGNVVSVFSNSTAADTSPYTTTVSVVTANTGAISSVLVNTGVPSVPAVQAIGSFVVTAGVTATQATGTVTITTNPTGLPKTVTIGNIVYSLVSAIVNTTPNQVFVGASNNATAANLNAAIMNNGTPGTQYSSSTLANPLVTSLVSTNVVSLTAVNGGTPGNSVALATNDPAQITVSGATLTGGTNNNVITAVNVGTTNLLSANVPYNQTATQTAIDLVTNINANNTGFTASANLGAVTITGPSASSNAYNNLPVSVVVSNTSAVCIQQIVFAAAGSPTSNTDNVSSVTVGGGGNIMTATITYRDAGHAAETVTQFIGRVAANIAANGGTSGYVAASIGQTLYISPVTSASNVTPGAVVITTAGTLTWAVNTTSSLTATLSTYSITGTANTFNALKVSTPTVTCLPAGGNAPYTFVWSYVSDSLGGGGPRLTAGKPTSIATSWTNGRTLFRAQLPYSEQWVCTVYDSGSAHVTTLPVTIYIP